MKKIFFQNFVSRKCPKRYPEMCWKCTQIRSRSIQTPTFSRGGGRGGGGLTSPPHPTCFQIASLPTRFARHGPIIRNSAYYWLSPKLSPWTKWPRKQNIQKDQMIWSVRPFGNLDPGRKNLGIMVDQKLTFEMHISTKVNKAHQIMEMVRRSFAHMDPENFRWLYRAVVRPI